MGCRPTARLSDILGSRSLPRVVSLQSRASVPRYQRLSSLPLVAVAATGCAAFSGGSGQAGARLGEPQATFWASLQALCGKAFEDKALVMHARECSNDVIRIPFHVGTDRRFRVEFDLTRTVALPPPWQ